MLTSKKVIDRVNDDIEYMKNRTTKLNDDHFSGIIMEMFEIGDTFDLNRFGFYVFDYDIEDAGEAKEDVQDDLNNAITNPKSSSIDTVYDLKMKLQQLRDNYTDNEMLRTDDQRLLNYSDIENIFDGFKKAMQKVHITPSQAKEYKDEIGDDSIVDIMLANC